MNRRPLARSALSGLARDGRDLAALDADRRQGPADADAVGESWLAGSALRDGARARHLADSGRRRDPRARVRLHRPPPRRANQPRRGADARARAADRRRLPSSAHGRPWRPRRRGRDQGDAERGREPDPLLAGPRPRRLRCRRGASLLARARPGRSHLQALPHRLSRQGEPGAFLLGQLRPRGDAVLGAAGAAASRRRARAAGRGHARGLFARGRERRFLARQRRLPARRVLRLRLSGAGGLPRPACDARRPLRAGARRVHPALRDRPGGGGSGRAPARFPRRRPMRPRPTPAAGTAPRSNARSAFRGSRGRCRAVSTSSPAPRCRGPGRSRP